MRRIAEVTTPRGVKALLVAVLVLAGLGSGVGAAPDAAHAASGAPYDAAKYICDLGVDPALSRSLVSSGSLAPRADAPGASAASEVVGHIYASSAAFVAPSASVADDIGLSGRGLIPATGTRVRPAGVPDSWRIVPTRSGGGARHYDPQNPGNSVRVMQGSPSSPYPNSQAPYVRWQRNGHPLDVNGKILPSANVPEAHIPLGDFRFLPEVFGP